MALICFIPQLIAYYDRVFFNLDTVLFWLLTFIVFLVVLTRGTYRVVKEQPRYRVLLLPSSVVLLSMLYFFIFNFLAFGILGGITELFSRLPDFFTEIGINILIATIPVIISTILVLVIKNTKHSSPSMNID